jgi:LAO/AO transport system kinase
MNHGTGKQLSARSEVDVHALALGVQAGDRRALARAISLVENANESGRQIVEILYPNTGKSRLLGITGPPGVGKSSLVSALVHHIRANAPDSKVGVIGVDPSSPFTHGALLGDRIRLSEHFLDRSVFIRSMSSRGHLGGLSETSLQVALLMDAYGADELILETVGVGQSEVEIGTVADTVVLVMMPGSGDAVQALKAGIMEIPDVIVINKADHPDARTLHQHIRAILAIEADREWKPAIIETTAIDGGGVPKLWDAIMEHREYLALEGRLDGRRRTALTVELESIIGARAMRRVAQLMAEDKTIQARFDDVLARKLDPLTFADQVGKAVFT